MTRDLIIAAGLLAGIGLGWWWLVVIFGLIAIWYNHLIIPVLGALVYDLLYLGPIAWPGVQLPLTILILSFYLLINLGRNYLLLSRD